MQDYNTIIGISNNAKLLYGLMLDRMSLSARSGWFDGENRVFIKYALKSIMEDLNCSKMTAVGLLKELQGIGQGEVQILDPNNNDFNDISFSENNSIIQSKSLSIFSASVQNSQMDETRSLYEVNKREYRI